MNKAKLFDEIRPMFGGTMNVAQVAGVSVLLDAAQSSGVTDIWHVANILAQVKHETGGHMSPIKETVMPSHKDKNPSDATVIKRLDQAYAKGQLSWVKKPYWRDGWFGRGPVQVTHKDNYAKVGKAIGVDLVANRNLALDAKVGARIAVIGMRDGLFTGRKLANYNFPGALDLAPADNPRRIINGNDGTDAKIAQSTRAFVRALTDSGFMAVSSKPVAAGKPPEAVATAKPNWLAQIIAAIVAAFRGTRK
ncbi:MAG: glycoside hydrolase family 19 protein [Cypionkella sp.]|nr:glycoside hydrolase family 19 protein [Cypionkella sp.]